MANPLSKLRVLDLDRRALQREIDMELRKQASAYWLSQLSDAGVPSGPINSYEQVLQHSQVIHRVKGSAPTVR